MNYALGSFLFVIPLTIGFTASAYAADCKERAEKVHSEIKHDEDKYSRESRTEANKRLMHANLPSVKPMQCSEHITKAMKALREGRQ